ncbi:hypothetical protein [Aquimarina sediminis]|uniref:hypothetical protein n=1 Tax=Aquimarina sediminis TaxID=2070536 RepID=UPI000CA08D45|nr:hypothetical protein [Aquimarina sediminis]
MAQEFSIKRIGGFIYRDIVLLKSTIITGLSVTGGLLFIGFLFNLREDYHLTPNEFVSVFFKFYIPVGLLLCFTIFKEAHSQKTNQFYFSLPVSSYERIAAAWFTTSIIYTVVFTTFGFLVGQFAIVTGIVVSQANFHVVPIFSENYWKVVAFYFLIQPTFLLGAVTFSKNRIGKTLLSILLIVFGLVVYNFILFGVLNIGYEVFSGEKLASDAFDLTSNDFSGIGSWFWIIVLGIGILLATYYKITEKEA